MVVGCCTYAASSLRNLSIIPRLQPKLKRLRNHLAFRVQMLGALVRFGIEKS
uniref:Uncharacterized protein n=1 Tax=Physcomitrium patens TaxID=3218 RepID=A0A2K1KZI9_PHYPA|nr:hypothetical protein PHYPA_002008 [Physcomitrium patens]